MSSDTGRQSHLEDRLRRHLADAVREAEPAQALWTGVRRGIQRRGKRLVLARMASIVGALCVSTATIVLLATGYQTHHPRHSASSPEPSIVPWAPLSPAPATPSGYEPPCKASDLEGTVFTEGATGSAAGVLQLRNVTGKTCVVRGVPGSAFWVRPGSRWACRSPRGPLDRRPEPACGRWSSLLTESRTQRSSGPIGAVQPSQGHSSR